MSERYVPQVGDVVEWIEDEWDGAAVSAGDRGSGPIGTVLSAGDSWATVAIGGASRGGKAAEPANSRYPHRCDRGHRAYVGLGAVECPTCMAIADLADADDPGAWPDTYSAKRLARGESYYRLWNDHGGWDHPTFDGAVALWRAAEVARLDAEGRR